MSIPVLSSRIDSVTVYRQGALVSRLAAVPMEQPVPPQVKLVNLPLSLDDGSVRVRIEGEGKNVLVASDVRVALDLAAADESLLPPDDAALVQAQRTVHEIAERVVLLESQRRRIERLQILERPAGQRGQPPPPTPVEARLTLLEFYHQSLTALDDELARTRAEERRAIQVKDDLEHSMRAASRARQGRPHELRKVAIVSLRAPAEQPAGPTSLVIEYMVPGARWAPSYGISLTRDMSKATLSVRAAVAQSTGEDWTNVRLTLATADAQRWTELPELQALRIGRRQPAVQRRGWRAPPAGAIELYGDYDRFLAKSAGLPPPAAVPRSAPADDEPSFAGMTDFDEEHTPTYAGAPPLAAQSPAEAEFFDGMVQPEHAPFRQSELKKERRAPSAPMQSRGAAPGAAPPAGRISAPMPAMMAPAAPQAMVSRAAAKSGSGFGSMIAGAIGGIGGLVAGAAGGMAPSAAYGAPPAEPEAPGSLEAAPEQLAYGNLRMPGPRDGRRGSLIVAQRRERYLEMLWVRAVTKEFDVVAVVDAAVGQAQRAGAQGLPPRHHLATSWAGFDYAYAAESTVDIPSDGDYHGIPLMSRPAAAELGYLVVPRESTDVFRHVKLENPLDAPLLPGPADVYVGGDYLLSTELRVAPPRGEVQIGLGVEQAIKISRNTSFTEESAGLMGGSLALRHEIAIEVANRRDRLVKVEVQERIPTTREKEDEITVDVGQVEPAWTAFEPEEYALKGGYRWQIEVPPGQQKKLRATYTIKISAKKELVGGNRREQ